MDVSDIDVLIEKNLQVRSAGRRNIGKFSVPNFKRVEKTTVSMNIIANGLSKDHKKPKTEFLYLNLNSLIVRFFTSS